MIGERIKELRGGESQGKFADRFGVSRNTVMRYENGDRHPDDIFISDLCKAYNVSADWLVLGKEADKTTAISVEEDKLEYAAGDEIAMGLAESVELLAKIYNSGEKVLIRAISANLHAFGEAVTNKRLAQKALDSVASMNERLEILEKEMKKLKEENEQLRKEPPGQKQQANGY